MKGRSENQDVDTFCTKIISAEAHGLEPTAWHEAGHRLMWRYLFPEVRTYYGIFNGYPAVYPDKATDNTKYKIAEMSRKEAAEKALVKLAGYAAEMILLGITDIKAVAEFIDRDTKAKPDKRRFDWDEDDANDGDIPQAITLIGHAGMKMPDALAAAFQDCINAISANREIFDAEVKEVTAMLDAWNVANNIKPM